MKKNYFINLKNNDDAKILKERTKLKVKCSCGHSVFFPSFVDKKICNWCKNYVYRTKEIEFKEKLKREIKNESKKK